MAPIITDNDVPILNQSTPVRTDIRTLLAILAFAIAAAIAYASLKNDNSRLADKLSESVEAQHATEARLASTEARLMAIERWQIETLTTLRIKGVVQ